MPKPSLCLNMIVKNEAARIERCLASVLPYVKSVAIMDTGSTDDTTRIIRRLCQDAEVPCIINETTFRDYSQARNEAFMMAHSVNYGDRWCQFALMVDADMQLVVEDPHAFDNLDAKATAYDMMQKGGAISYGNRRLVNLDWPKRGPYVGVTHEYIDVPAAGMIQGAFFVDHADGANRGDKYPRDAALLNAALKDDPNNGRYLYYLGNTYRDWGKPEKAIDAYTKRIALGGWDEETHSAMMNKAFCFKNMGNEVGFVAAMLDAYAFRPERAETLYDLAKYFREKGQPANALLFAKKGLSLKRPTDLLFINDFVYEHGLKYEYSIAGYYDEADRPGAFQITNNLSLDPTCPEQYRASARSNLYHFTRSLADYCPSFKDKRLNFPAPEGYVAMNPSIEECDGRLLCNVRCVNYIMDEAGRYIIQGGTSDVIDTRNFIVSLDNDLDIKGSGVELLWERPPAEFPLVIGLEDVRLWRHQGNLWFNACVRERSKHGTCQQAIGRIVSDSEITATVNDFQIVSGEHQNEKNWMHIDRQRFMYRLDTIIDPLGPRVTEKFETKLAVENISGSSQCIEFKAGWLACVHEAVAGPDGKRTYWHRWAWFDNSLKLRRLSLPFVFLGKQIEFCAGLAYHPNLNDLIISYGVRDAEAHLATVSIEDVSTMVWKFYEN